MARFRNEEIERQNELDQIQKEDAAIRKLQAATRRRRVKAKLDQKAEITNDQNLKMQ